MHLYSSSFSSHLIYQILMIIIIPTNTLGSAYVPPPPFHLKIKYMHCLYVGNKSCHTLVCLGKLSPLNNLKLEPLLHWK